MTVTAAARHARLRDVLVRLGRLLHDELGARHTDGDALCLQRIQHFLSAPASRQMTPRDERRGARARTWYSSLLRELFRLLARPAPWHVLHGVGCTECAPVSKSVRRYASGTGAGWQAHQARAPAECLLHALLGSCQNIAAGALSWGVDAPMRQAKLEAVDTVGAD
jgi:hypothetical protein